MTGLMPSGTVRRYARQFASEAGRVPVLGRAVRLAYDRYFDAARGSKVRLFRGIYPDFASALAAAPAGRDLSYDNEASAQRVIDEFLRISPYDYPVMFWLGRIVPNLSTVFDWGGNVGLKYFAYRRYLDFAEDLRWIVCDVPAVVAAGQAVARREGATALEFTTSLDGLASADLLFASGAVHFIERPFELLRSAPSLPRHLLFSKVPVYASPSAVTLQNMGTAVCPYHLFNRDEFVRNTESLGYRLVDEWKAPDLSCRIPFFPERSVDAYSGFYFSGTAK